MADLDGDGVIDLLSGSWPGEIYLFLGGRDGGFRAGEALEDREGKPINVGHAAAAFAADWDGDGDLDLVVGTLLGEVHLVPNGGSVQESAFGASRRLVAGGEPIVAPDGDAGPVIADWDGDGKLDLIVGTGAGSVLWYRNLGPTGAPRLARAETLVEASPIGWADDARRRAGDWGLRAKVCVTDWDGDGRPNLLLGDICGGFEEKPRQEADERAVEARALDVIPELNREWAAAFRRYRALLVAPGPDGEQGRCARTGELSSLRATLRRYKDEIAEAQRLQALYRPQYQHHGFVWLFRRQPAHERAPDRTHPRARPDRGLR